MDTEKKDIMNIDRKYLSAMLSDAYDKGREAGQRGAIIRFTKALEVSFKFHKVGSIMETIKGTAAAIIEALAQENKTNNTTIFYYKTR